MAIACHSHRRYLLQFIDHLSGWGSSDGMDQVELPVEGYVAGSPWAGCEPGSEALEMVISRNGTQEFDSNLKDDTSIN